MKNATKFTKIQYKHLILHDLTCNDLINILNDLDTKLDKKIRFSKQHDTVKTVLEDFKNSNDKLKSLVVPALLIPKTLKIYTFYTDIKDKFKPEQIESILTSMAIHNLI